MTSSVPNLEGLEELTRLRGVDTRPTLARVLTDLYVQKSAHTLDEEVHYTELVLRLLEAVEVSTRAVVARKLAAYPAAPRAVVLRLARDVIEVADPILRHSPCLPGPELIAIIEECGPPYAAAIAARRTRADGTSESRAPAPRPGAGSLLPRSSQWRRAAVIVEPAAPATVGIGLGELFLMASSEERRVILANLDATDAAPAPAASDCIARLEAAALARTPGDFARELERALGLGAPIARRMVDDPNGEPLLLAVKALGMSSEALVRILLFLNPTIGESVSRVFGLAQLYLDLPYAAAAQLVASLRGGAAARASHQPALFSDEADSGRRAGMDAARRGLAPPQPARHEGSIPARRHGTT